MTEYITGQQARELLELPDIAAPWVIEQRNLAETVAWLYGKSITPDESEGDYYSTFRGGYTYADQGHVHLNVELSDAFTPDEAVDLARALLAAAEEARDGADR